MIKTIVYLFLVIIIIIFITNKILKINNFMNIYELIEFNYKLILISNSGLTYIKRTGAKILDIFTVDPLLIKMNRRLQKKYGKYINTYIVTKTKNYYILDAQHCFPSLRTLLHFQFHLQYLILIYLNYKF